VGEAEGGKIERHKRNGEREAGKKNREKIEREKEVTNNSKHFRPELLKPTFLLHSFLVIPISCCCVVYYILFLWRVYCLTVGYVYVKFVGYTLKFSVATFIIA
jgi:hypothetical protein